MNNQWYVVLTKPKQERRALEHFEQQGGTVFLPMFFRERVTKGKLSQISEPLFPGYLFLNVANNESLLAKVRSTLGARQLLAFGSQPVRVSSLLINDLKARCNPSNDIKLFSDGQKVTIKSGPFSNYEAVFREYDGQTRAILLLNILGQQNELLVELADFDVASSA